ncbi:MAG: hypothetical protein JWQ40_247 [Segetibacter sp.]|nr:hypothetical protein [Segetibacter sp.]
MEKTEKDVNFSKKFIDRSNALEEGLKKFQKNS